MTNQLRIAELPTGNLGGVIGVTFAPGKKQSCGMAGSHGRHLDVDLDVRPRPLDATPASRPE